MAVPGVPVVSGEAALIIGIVLVIVGLALAFWGHGIWSSVMSLIGALLGSAVGFLFGTGFGVVAALLLALVGVVGLLAGAAVYALLRGQATFTPGQMDPPLIAALLVLVVVFGISYYFIDDLIGIITAALGGLLLAGGLYFLQGPGSGTTSALAGLGVFVLGAATQTATIRRRKRARAAATASPPPPP